MWRLREDARALLGQIERREAVAGYPRIRMMPHSGGFVQVVDCSPGLLSLAQLRDRIWPFMRDIAAAIEHAGSTSVP